MDMVDLFEQLASNVHHRVELDKLLSEQPDALKKAFLMNDAESVKKQFKDTEYLADTCRVY